MNKEFERLPEIARLIEKSGATYNVDCGWYDCVNLDSGERLDLALYAYQEQQKKIDAVLDFIDSDDLGHDARLGDFYRDIKELLK